MRWKCVCAYNGGAFQGWQSQRSGLTVQDTLEARLAALFLKPVRIHGCSRTDTGVHARRMVFHFDADWDHPHDRLLTAFRMGLPQTLFIRSVRRVPETFHARHSARGKRYCYYIYEGWADPFRAPFCWSHPRDLNTGAMQEAAKSLVGRHDFHSFAGVQRKDPADSIRTLSRLEVVKRGRVIRVIAEADGFLYKMMRGITGGLVQVGIGKLEPADIPRLMRARKRTAEIPTAPPQGLFLERVFY